MLQLPDDVLLYILAIACCEPKDFINLRGVCKRLLVLSEYRQLWLNLYAYGGFGRVYGPPSWHSTEFIKERALRYQRMNRNLESASPKYTHQVFKLPNDIRQTHLHVVGRFMLSVKKDASLVCLDMGMGLRQLWAKDPWTSDPFEVEYCNIKHPEGLGHSVMSVLISMNGQSVMIVTLNLFFKQMDYVELVEAGSKTIDAPVHFIFCWQQDWLAYTSEIDDPPILTVLNTQTDRIYRAKMPNDYHIDTCTFIGTGHLLVIYDVWSSGTETLVVFPLPRSDVDPATLEFTHQISSVGNTNFYKEILPAWYHDSDSVTVDYPLSAFLKTSREGWNGGVNSPVVDVVQITVSKMFNQHDSDNRHVFLYAVDYPQPALVEETRRYPFWLIGETGGSLVFTRGNYSSDSAITFGTPIPVHLGLEHVLSRPHSEDEYSGNCFFVPNSESAVHVVGFA